jgi:hypothetical protein
VHQWGLLGILPAKCEIITFKKTPDVPNPKTPEVPKTSDECCYVRYIRHAGVWSRNEFTSAIPQAAVARVWRSELNDFEEQHLEDAVFPFFPAALRPKEAGISLVPRPCSEAFWHSYAEPLDEFLKEARAFCKRLETVGAFQGASRVPDRPVNEALYELEGLTVSIGTSGSFDAGTRQFRNHLVSPSLLAFFAKMALLDLEEGRRPHRCKTCSKVFISGDARALYCSQRCRNTMQRRRQRAGFAARNQA